MYQKISITDLMASIQNNIRKTGKECYDNVPANKESPFYYAELVGIEPENTKTMYVDVYTIVVHAIAEESNSSIGIHKMIQDLEEVMSDNICIEGLLMQSSQGLQRLKKDETNEYHAIMVYEFKISYGYKIK